MSGSTVHLTRRNRRAADELRGVKLKWYSGLLPDARPRGSSCIRDVTRSVAVKYHQIGKLPVGSTPRSSSFRNSSPGVRCRVVIA